MIEVKIVGDEPMYSAGYRHKFDIIINVKRKLAISILSITLYFFYSSKVICSLHGNPLPYSGGIQMYHSQQGS